MLRDSSGRSADTSGEHGGAREVCGGSGFAAPDFSLCHYVGSRNAAAGGRRRHCGITAAVGESEEQRKPERFSGYRKAESRNAAAGGRVRHCGKPAAVGESEERRKPERFSGYRKADRGRFLIREVIRGRRSFPGCMSAPDFGFLQLRGRGACRLAFRFSFFLFRIFFSLPGTGIKSQVILDRKGPSP